MTKRSGVPGVAQAISYGPFSYAHALIAGFLLGSLGFLAGAALNGPNSGIDDLPVMLLCSAGGTLFMMFAAVSANYLIGSRILSDMQSRAAEAANPALRRTLSEAR